MCPAKRPSLKCIVLALICIGDASAQQARHSGAQMAVISVSEKPVIETQLPSPMAESTTCTSDGSIVSNLFLPTTEGSQSDLGIVTIVSPDGLSRRFDVASVTDVKNARYTFQKDVGEHDVVLLVIGSDQGSTSGEVGYYLSRFDRQGGFHGSTSLKDLRIIPSQMSVFPNGDMLFIGTNRTTQKPEIVKYSPIGNQQSSVRLDSPLARTSSYFALPKGNAFSKGEADDLGAQFAAGFSQLSHYRDSILMVQRGAKTPLLQVFSNGLVKVLSIPVLDGFAPDSIVSSDTSIYVRYTPPPADGEASDKAFLMQVSDDTGSEIRRLRVRNGTPWSVVCAKPSGFTTIKFRMPDILQVFDATVE